MNQILYDDTGEVESIMMEQQKPPANVVVVVVDQSKSLLPAIETTNHSNHNNISETNVEQQKNNTNIIVDNDEQALFASMDALLVEQNVYEKDVLHQASYQTVPLLDAPHSNDTGNDDTDDTQVLPGFPLSMTLELMQPFHESQSQQQSISAPPSKLNRRNIVTNTVFASNVLQSILENVRHQQQEEEEEGLTTIATTKNEVRPNIRNLLNMKEQILLHLLSTIDMTTSKSTTSTLIRTAATTTTTDDDGRKKMTLTSKPSSMDMRMKSKMIGSNATRRIPMMKRKRMAATAAISVATGEKCNDKDKNSTSTITIEQIEELKALRLQRMKLRQHKYFQIGVSSNHDDPDDIISIRSDVEQEMDDPIRIPDEEEQHNSNDDGTNKYSTTNTTNTAIDNVVTANRTISCPLCQQDVLVEDIQDADTVLAAHMNECQQHQQNTYTTRSKRQRRATVAYQEVQDDNDEDQPVVDATTTMKKMYQKMNVAKVAPKASQPLDDMDENDYDDRVDEWIVNGLRRMKNMKERDPNEILPNDIEYDNHLYIPAWMNNHLFQYQRDGIEWMYRLHQQMTGGIMGDEMGLGKTVQVAAFLGAAAASRLLKSVLIVAPATILQHWLTELAIWAPGLRRILIHSSGGTLDRFDRSISYPLLQSLSKWLQKSRSHRVNEPIDDDDWEIMDPHSFCGTGYAIVTTYENLRRNSELYASHDWSYIVLDEAQKIRNPDADITLACKRIRTPHRLAMSGTPIQNDLRELWSLLDFVFPGRLGTLPTFEQEFAVPIKYGGYSNASPMQVQLAYRCAVMLRDMIEPFLLRRLKKDVKEVSRMPGKTEHVLFCRLSRRQRAMYEAYLLSDDVSRVFRGNHMLLAAVTVLRKIANHPDLVCDPSEAALDSFINNRGNTIDSNKDDASNSDEYAADDGYVGDEQSLLERSGKLDVLAKILPIWKKQGHRVLIFCQWRKMLDIIERFVQLQGWKFGRLDGNTNIASRQRLVDSFNTDESYFGMLCTTRTGGVGLNLIGANRCILYDPDWNPSGDAQARERAWRFGQEKEVTIYRLITAGTIEEKIYQRQIFKTAMTNKVLQDAKQRRLFSQRDLKDLFSLSEDTGSIRSGGDGITATSAITNGVGVVESADLEGNGNGDNDVALKKLMKSKGLAGIFDHHSIEPDHKRKSITLREMEERAKQVAKEAAQALQNSVVDQDPFTPTWTGSKETKPDGIFGSNRVLSFQGGGNGTTASTATASLSSSSLLATIRQRNTEIESDGRTGATTETQKYTKLLSNLKEYVKRHRPSTEDILKEFDDIPDTDVAIFRRLLKSIATMQKGRWYLNDNC